MNFKEALIAHLQGEKVEVASKLATGGKFVPLLNLVGGSTLEKAFSDNDFASACEFRLAPRTIFVNGVEVPAPESENPKEHAAFFIPRPDFESMYEVVAWRGWRDGEIYKLKAGLVYLNKEGAIARAKAMLLTSDK